MTPSLKALAALTLSLGLVGCGNEPAATDSTTSKPDSTAPAADPGPAVTPSTTPSLPDGKDATPKIETPSTPTDAPKLEAPGGSELKKEDMPK